MPIKCGLLRIATSIAVAVLCTALATSSSALTVDQVTDQEIYRQISSKEVATRALEFLRTKPFPQKQKEGLLENSRPEDRVELKRLLSTWKPERFLLTTENDALTISNEAGKIELEISQQPSDGQIIINGKPFQVPQTGSIFGALRKHARSEQTSLIDLLFPSAKAVSADVAVALPAYFYVEFANAFETPTKSHTAEDEAEKSARQLQDTLMPAGSNSLVAYAKRYFSDTKSSVTCNSGNLNSGNSNSGNSNSGNSNGGNSNGATASGLVKLAGDLHRFESRPNGDVVILPPFENGSAVLLKPSRVDLGQVIRTLADSVSQHQRAPSVQSAMQIVDGPIRTICQRLQLMKPNPRAASMCEKLYLQNISREGRCSRLQGDFKTMCRAGGDLLPDRLTKIFEQDLLKFLAAESAEILALGKSLESSQIIGRKMFFHQCLDGSVCNNTYFPTVLEAVQPSPGEVSEKVQDLLAYRHRSTGSSALVEYHCEVQNETCAALTNTDAAHSLPKKDFEILRMQISQANRQRPFKKAAFLEQASALRPLGQCCSSTACRSKLQALTAGAVKFSDSERTAK